MLYSRTLLFIHPMYKIYRFKEYSSVAFSTFMMLCIRHPCLVPERFRLPERKPRMLRAGPALPGNQCSFSVYLPVPDISYEWNRARRSLRRWLLSLTVRFWIFFRVVHVSVLCSFLWLNNFPLYGQTTLCLSIQQLMSGLFSSFGYCE